MGAAAPIKETSTTTQNKSDKLCPIHNNPDQKSTSQQNTALQYPMGSR